MIKLILLIIFSNHFTNQLKITDVLNSKIDYLGNYSGVIDQSNNITRFFLNSTNLIFNETSSIEQNQQINQVTVKNEISSNHVEAEQSTQSFWTVQSSTGLFNENESTENNQVDIELTSQPNSFSLNLTSQQIDYLTTESNQNKITISGHNDIYLSSNESTLNGTSSQISIIQKLSGQNKINDSYPLFPVLNSTSSLNLKFEEIEADSNKTYGEFDPDPFIIINSTNFTLKAYKSNNSEVWYTLGIPTLKPKSNRFKSSLINFNRNGFYILFEMLDQNLKKFLSQEINRKYNLNINEQQIELIKPDSLKCSFKMVCGNLNVSLNPLDGVLTSFLNESIVKVDFSLVGNENERICLDLILDKNENSDFDVECSLIKERVETLEISTTVFDDLKFYDKIFEYCDESYLTYFQVEKLALDLFEYLNLSNRFNINQTYFTDLFVLKFLNKKNIHRIDFLQAISILSKNLNNNLTKPYTYYHKLTKLISINFTDSQHTEYLISLNKRVQNYLSQNSLINDMLNPIVKFHEKYDPSQEGLKYYSKNFTHLQNTYNNLEKTIIEWEEADEELIPKNLDLIKLNKTDLLKNVLTYRFNSISKISNLLETSFKLNKEKIKLEIIQADDISYREYSYNFISVYDNPNIKYNLIGHTAGITSLVVLSDGNLASSSFDFTIKIWDMKQKYIKKSISTGEHKIYNMVLLKNGDLACSTTNFHILILNPDNGIIKHVIKAHDYVINSLIVFDNNGDLASGSNDGRIKVWNPVTGKIKANVKQKNNSKFYSLVKLTNDELIATADMKITILNLRNNSIVRTFNDRSGTWLAKLVNNNDLAYAYHSNINIMNLSTGQVKNDLKGHTGFVRTLLALPNGYLASGSLDNRVIIWDPNNKRNPIFKILEGHKGEVYSLALMPNGNLVSGSNDNKIIVWKTNFL